MGLGGWKLQLLGGRVRDMLEVQHLRLWEVELLCRQQRQCGTQMQLRWVCLALLRLQLLLPDLHLSPHMQLACRIAGITLMAELLQCISPVCKGGATQQYWRGLQYRDQSGAAL